ncbi:MAG: helix-turn-helix transcriptional regulator [Clostridia bacterium]|nr:helix-turn-helix transcriptional regulator [Clostridia bacterium]
MEYQEKLKKNLKFFRKQIGLTQGELAEKLNGRKSLVSNYENGYSTPDIFTLITLADLFKVTLDELVGRI